MFVLRDGSTFDWVVKAKVPEGKKRVGVSFDVTFNILDQSIIEELIVDMETRDVTKFLELAIVSFDGLPVQDADGEDITDNDERNSMLCKSSLFIDALVSAYSAGVAGHKTKN